MEQTNNATATKKVIYNLHDVDIIGRIGTLEVKEFTTKNGKTSKFAHLSVATNDRKVEKYENGRPVYAKDENGKFIYKDTPQWHNITAFKGNWVTNLENLKVGQCVHVRGRLTYESFELKNADGTPVLLNGKPYSATRAIVMIDGESGSLGVINDAPAAPAAQGSDGVDEM